MKLFGRIGLNEKAFLTEDGFVKAWINLEKSLKERSKKIEEDIRKANLCLEDSVNLIGKKNNCI